VLNSHAFYFGCATAYFGSIDSLFLANAADEEGLAFFGFCGRGYGEFACDIETLVGTAHQNKGGNQRRCGQLDHVYTPKKYKNLPLEDFKIIGGVCPAWGLFLI
jgi:hypothetical protein